MKTLTTLTLCLSLALFQPVFLKADKPINNDQLKKQIEQIVQKATLKNMEADTEEVTVHFLINAQHELVIFDTSGDNASACEQVKALLNYKQVRYAQAKQLTPYEINIRFVKKT